MFHEIVQVYPIDRYRVNIYFDDGRIKLYDTQPLLNRGVFSRLQDIDFFKNACTIMNDTRAWDLSGRFDPTDRLDLDPEVLYETSADVSDPFFNMDAAGMTAIK